MTPPSLLAALASTLAPEHAACLARACDPAAVAEGARLARLPRPERLAALASALAADRGPSAEARERAAAQERPHIARLLREGTAPDPLLARLAVERMWR